MNSAVFTRILVVNSLAVLVAKPLLRDTKPKSNSEESFRLMKPCPRAANRVTIDICSDLLPLIRAVLVKGCTLALTVGSGQVSCNNDSKFFSTCWLQVWATLRSSLWKVLVTSSLPRSHLILRSAMRMSPRLASAESPGSFLLNLAGMLDS